MLADKSFRIDLMQDHELAKNKTEKLAIEKD